MDRIEDTLRIRASPTMSPSMVTCLLEPIRRRCWTTAQYEICTHHGSCPACLPAGNLPTTLSNCREWGGRQKEEKTMSQEVLSTSFLLPSLLFERREGRRVKGTISSSTLCHPSLTLLSSCLSALSQRPRGQGEEGAEELFRVVGVHPFFISLTSEREAGKNLEKDQGSKKPQRRS